MKSLAAASLVVTLLVGAAGPGAQPAAPKEHQWHHQLAGEWEYDAELLTEPGKPAVKVKGTESARKLGEHWVIGELKASDASFTAVLTVGYDTRKKKYVATWVDTIQSHLILMEGTVDAGGKTLSLLTEAPNHTTGKLSKFKEVIEIKTKDHKVHTSSVQGEDGKWVVFMTAHYKRKK
jgi:hypothetical protein